MCKSFELFMENYLWNVAKNKRKIVPYNICIRPVFSEVFQFILVLC